jgi:thioredoxin-related protein
MKKGIQYILVALMGVTLSVASSFSQVKTPASKVSSPAPVPKTASPKAKEKKAGSVQEPKEIQWMSFEEAAKRSEKSPRKIVIDIYTSWCGWCKRLDATTYQDPEVIKYINKKFYAVKLDAEIKDTIRFKDKIFTYIPERKANELALSLLNGSMSYPSTVFLDEKFSMLAPVPGYHDAREMLELFLKYFGDEIYKTKKWEDYQKEYNSLPAQH